MNNLQETTQFPTGSNRYIAVSYQLFVDNEAGVREIVEEAPAQHPFQFISGLGMALEAFESQVAHLNEGDSFEFTLSVEDAYGPYEEEHVIEVPKQTFVVNGRFDTDTIYAGAVLPLVNEDGLRFDGLVLEVKEDVVVLDLNHPLAGKTLHYKGKVEKAREASNEEIQGALNMMSGEGCGCGCDHDHEHGEGGCGCGGHHHHEHGEEGCACGGHHHHEHDEEGCGCDGHHHHEHGEEGCACGGHHHN